jgi:type II secretory pathway pseudopilin PulG
MNRKPSNNARGFSTVQLLITLAVMSIITGFAVVGITRARDHVRLMSSARQFAAYVERARADAVRRHNGATVSIIDNNTYAVTMDWDGFGTLSTRNFDLEPGVAFTTGIKSITFDWRGRATNGEESFGFNNGFSVNVHVTGSGDVTFEAEQFFDASLPPVTLNGNPGGVMPDPTASPGQGSPTPSPSPGASPSPGTGPSPTPTTDPSPTPTTYPSPTATPTATPSSSPGASPTPIPSPTLVPCTLTANPTSLGIVSNGSASVSVNRDFGVGTATITATSNNSGQIQVSPTSQSVTGTAAATFGVTVKRTSGSVTFSASGCTSTTVNVTIR